MDELLLLKVKKLYNKGSYLENMNSLNELTITLSSRISNENHLAEIKSINSFFSNDNKIDRINILDFLSTDLVYDKEINIIKFNEKSDFFYLIILRNITMHFAWPHKHGLYDDFEDLMTEALNLIQSFEEKSKSELIKEASNFEDKMFDRIKQLRAKHGIYPDMGE